MDDWIQTDGVSVTIKHRSTEYFGNPTCVAGTGGSMGAGTYYLRANPVKASVEYQMGDETQIVVSATGKITATLPNLGAGVTFNVYVSPVNDLYFATPCLAASGQASGSYVYSGAALSSGAPVEAQRNPFVVWASTAAKCFRKHRVSAPDVRALQEGVGPLDEYILQFGPDETISNGDFVVMDGLEYYVENTKAGLTEGSTTKVITAQVQRGRLQQ